MANSALPAINLLQEPGFLYWAPLGSTTPTNTVASSAYTDTWPVAWVPLGATDSGTDFTYTTTVQPVTVAELYDPVTYRTTDRTGSIAFALASITSGNLIKSFNGAVNTVTGSGATQSTHISPVGVGNEVRCMIGWESKDSTVRIVGNQVMNSGSIKLSFNKAPAKATIPWVGNFEIPGAGTGNPWDIWTTR
jgi:hypothetical protein